MNKLNRYSLIKNLITKNSLGRLETSQSEIDEEKKLALAVNDDESILDDEEKNLYASPALVAIARLEKDRGEGEEGTLLTKKEIEYLSREVKRPVSLFKVKKREEMEGEEMPIEKIDIGELLSFAQYN